MTTYYLTPTALAHVEKIIRDTARKWGVAQARAYAAALEKGFEEIARKRESIITNFRADMAKDTKFALHLVEHHYVVFQPHGKNDVIIAAVLHEKMNIPVHLKTLNNTKATKFHDIYHRHSVARRNPVSGVCRVERS